MGSGGLFFLKDGQPWVWDRQSGEVSLYQLFPETSFGEEEVTPPPETAIPLGDVLDVETATKSGQVLFLRQESSGVFELLFAELNTARLQWRITVEASNLFELALSPDGRWLAYLTSVEGGEAFAQLVLLSTEDPQRSQAAAICETICADLLWTPDGARLVWADSDGVWGLALPLGAESQPESLAPQVLPSESPLSPVAFSPSGRFLLLESQGERADRWLLDTGSQRLEAVPGSFFFVPPAQSMTWLPDDRLLITRGGHKTQGLFPTLEIWRVNPQGEGSLFEMEFSMEITDSVSVAPLFPAQLPDGRLAFGLMNFSTPRFISTDGVYLFDGESESLVKVNDLPVAKYQEALWLPDGSAVMLLTSRRTLYVPLDGGRIYDLRLYLGVDACCFTWVSSP